jgi:hypothetical protein
MYAPFRSSTLWHATENDEPSPPRMMNLSVTAFFVLLQTWSVATVSCPKRVGVNASCLDTVTRSFSTPCFFAATLPLP